MHESIVWSHIDALGSWNCLSDESWVLTCLFGAARDTVSSEYIALHRHRALYLRQAWPGQLCAVEPSSLGVEATELYPNVECTTVGVPPSPSLGKLDTAEPITSTIMVLCVTRRQFTEKTVIAKCENYIPDCCSRPIQYVFQTWIFFAWKSIVCTIISVWIQCAVTSVMTKEPWCLQMNLAMPWCSYDYETSHGIFGLVNHFSFVYLTILLLSFW